MIICPYCYGENDHSYSYCYWCSMECTSSQNYMKEISLSNFIFSMYPKLVPTYDIKRKHILYLQTNAFPNANHLYLMYSIIKRINARKSKCWTTWKCRNKRKAVINLLLNKLNLLEDNIRIIEDFILKR